MPIITYPLTTAGNYTYGASIEVTGGVAQLADQTPVAATCLATYTTDINLNIGGGTLTGTAVGGAAVSGNALDLNYDDSRYVTYSPTGNAAFQQAGAIKFKYTPNYTGSPSGARTLFTICKAASDATNMIMLRHQSGGDFQILVKSSTDTFIISNSAMGAWSPTAAQTYEFELNVDITSGETRLFIDGVQFGSTETGTGTRDSDIGYFAIGSNFSGADNSDFSIEDLVVFDTVQHTTDYTSGYSLPEGLYSQANPTITPASTFDTDDVTAFTSTVVEAGSDAVKFVIEMGGANYYWTGAAWATSSGYAQSNTSAEINTNIGTLVTAGTTIRPVVYLHSDDGSTTPQLDVMALTYSLYNPADTLPTLCEVSGYLIDTDGTAINGATIAATLDPAGDLTTNYWVATRGISTTSDSNGYFELALMPSGEFEATTLYNIAITLSGETEATTKYSVTIPTQTAVDFKDL